MTGAWLWARNEWRRRWISLLLLSVLIALAGGVTIAAVAGARRADTAFERFVQANGEPDVGATVDFDARGFDADLAVRARTVFDEAARVPGVTGAVASAVWAITPGPPLEPWQFGPVLVAGRWPSQFVVAGRAPDAGDAHEVMLNERAAQGLGVGVGDPLVLHTVGVHQADEWARNNGEVAAYEGPDIPVTVAGISRSAEDIAQAEDATIEVTPAFYDVYHDQVFNCVCFNLFRVDHRHLDEVSAALTSLYAPYDFVVEQPEGGVLLSQAADGIDVEVTALRLLALAAGLAGILVVGQAMLRQASDTGGDDEVRRALGATRAQLIGSGSLVLAPSIALGAVGAVVLAIALSPLTPRGLAKQAEVDPGLRADWPVLILGGVAIAALGAVLAMWAARTAARRRARRPVRFLPLPTWLRPAPMMGVAFAVRPGRSRAAVWSALVATAIGIAGVIGVWSFEASRHHLLANPRLYGIDAQLATDVPSDHDGLAAIAQDVVGDPGVAAVSVLHTLSRDLTASHDGHDTPVNPKALESLKGLAGTTIVRGRFPAGPAEVTIGNSIAGAIHADIGDAVTVHGEGGDVTLTVVGRAVSWGTDEVGNGFQLTPDGLDTLAPEVCGDDESCRVDEDTIVVRTGTGADGRRAADRLQQASWTPIEPPSVVGNLGQAGSVPKFLAAFLALLGLGGLAHALVVTLRRSRRDVAIGRALGFTPRDARSTMRWDATTLAVGGIAVGVPAGIMAGTLAWSIVASGLGVVIRHALPWWAGAFVAGIVFVVALVFSALPARLAGRLRPAEILRAE